VAALGESKKPAVTVSIGGHTYRSTIAKRGADFLLPLSAENRTAAGAAAGDEVEVDVELDTAPRIVELPDDLAALLDADPSARAAYDALSFSTQRGLVEPIGQSKSDETRQRRIDKVMTTLRGA
jgi:hypothetical protein